MTKANTERAKKAWETMRKRGFHKYKDRKKDSFYNNPKKNKVRQTIVRLIKKWGGKSILTLETSNYALPEMMKKHTFFVAEENKEEYLKMLEAKPKNVFLHYGKVSEMKTLVQGFDVVYLDFCCGYKTGEKEISQLAEKIHDSKLVGFTFCLRKNQKEVGEDYTSDLIFKLMQFLGPDFLPVYKESYRDSSPMVTLFFAKKVEKKRKNIEDEDYDYDKERLIREKEKERKDKERRNIAVWSVQKIREIFPHVVNPSQIFDMNAKTCYFKNDYGERIVEKIFNLALEAGVIKYPMQCSYWGEQKDYYYDNKETQGMFNLYVDILFRKIYNAWTDKKFGDTYYHINWRAFSSSGDDVFVVANLKEKCFLCKKNKANALIDGKAFCLHCFFKNIIGNSNFSVPNNKHWEQKIIKKGYIVQSIYGSHYEGKRHCKYCEKEFCKFPGVEEEVVHFGDGWDNDDAYCKACFDYNIKPQIEDVIEIRKKYRELKKQKLIEVYNLKITP